jgi:RHH-type transcriptional regulator, proline utilization regulon repressor / proline dehydrogenase / delta 1-pyrroline-5-carboxylate dehydrogenase
MDRVDEDGVGNPEVGSSREVGSFVHGGSFEGLLPSRLTAADRAQIERRTQEIGRGLLERSLAEQPSAISPDWWVQQAGEWATQDEELKVRLFRLIDCMPMLDDAVAIDRHVREYLDEPLVERLPQPLKLALQAARSGMLAPLTARAVRAATLAQARRFIAGTNPHEAAQAALAERRRHRGFTLDLLGEAVTSEAEAEAYAAAYAQLLETLPGIAAGWAPEPLVDDGPDGPLPRVNVSIKLSALDSQFDAIDPAGTSDRVLARLRPLWRLARRNGAQVHVDMESHATKDLALAIFQRIAGEPEFRDWPHCGIVVQAYLRDAPRDLERLATWAAARRTPVWVRLVKGAYWDYETVHARSAGWPVPVWQKKWQTDACYEAATTFLLEHADVLRPALGSHNLRSLAHAMAVAEHLGLDRHTPEMQMLYGMGDPEKEAVTAAGWRMRVYMPYGQLVPGMAYLVRRLLENSSNDSFLRAGFVKHVPPATLLAPPRPAPNAERPREEQAASKETPTMSDANTPPEPAQFANEPLTDFTLDVSRQAMQAAVDRMRDALDRMRAAPGERRTALVPIVIDGRREEPADRFERRDPSDHARLVAEVCAADAATAVRAVEAAARGLAAWRARGFAERAEILRTAAAIMRRRRFDLAALEIFEVGKTWREADADVAEAIDFCEYYAREGLRLGMPRWVDVPGEENATTYAPRGVAVVIAPWNFPLAILCGMTTAALVTGNAVVMKPAEQSSRTGLALHEMLVEAGVPADAVHFLPGRGEVVGPALVTHPETAVLAFTGSRAVGLAINTRAAETAGQGGRLVKRVIAEMGGKNAIIVDDDADLDEAVVAVVQSAFGFQGQKCSACSRAVVLDSVYETFLERLAGAVRSLQVGPADAPGTRVGPLVDEESLARVRSFIEIGRRTGREVAAIDVGPLADRGWFVGPHVFADVDPAGPLGQQEIFGPVLGLFRARDFEHAITIANDTDYALTAGVFSRSPARLARARESLEAGNIYLNRGITGALVCRQPFGGYRMSGIGSKAGGPDYLLQFVVPRTVTENTLRRGFAPERPAGHGQRM